MTCYIYIPGLNPQGTIFSTTVCNEMRNIKQQDFFIYYRSQTDLAEEFKNFNRFFQMLSIKYKKFCLIGHSYGAVFAKYFGHKLGIFTITLDGSDLVETCEYIAYDLLKIDRSKKINYKHEFPICSGTNLIQKWFKTTLLQDSAIATKIECTWKEWLENVKIINKLKLKQKYIDIYYFPSTDNKLHVNVENKTENKTKISIQYGKTYCHSLHMYKPVAEEIFKIIDKTVRKQ